MNLPNANIFFVSREEGFEELKNGILSCYKRHDCNLKAPMRVRFEGEGTCREWANSQISSACNENCARRNWCQGKTTHFFEGESYHMLPVHDQTVRYTEAFRAVGRIIAHSVLHKVVNSSETVLGCN